MINYKLITQAIENILRDNLHGYTITRNAERNEDPNITMAAGTGWIGIYRGPLDYDAYAIGGTPWTVSPHPVIEIQCASMMSGDDAEDRLQDAEKEVLDVLTANKKLNNTVAMTLGYHIEYQYNNNNQVYFHSAIITINTEARA